MDVTTVLTIVIGLAIVAFAGRQVYLRWRVTSIDAAEASTRIRNNANVTVLDVRQPHEHAAGHIRGAVLLPLNEVGARADEVLSQGDDVIVVCASGNRSLSAANKLQGMGFERIVNLKGGMNAWQTAGLAVEKGEPKTRRRR